MRGQVLDGLRFLTCIAVALSCSSIVGVLLG